jgi:hypothetical protein
VTRNTRQKYISLLQKGISEFGFWYNMWPHGTNAGENHIIVIRDYEGLPKLPFVGLGLSQFNLKQDVIQNMILVQMERNS